MLHQRDQRAEELREDLRVLEHAGIQGRVGEQQVGDHVGPGRRGQAARVVVGARAAEPGGCRADDREHIAFLATALLARLECPILEQQVEIEELQVRRTTTAWDDLVRRVVSG